MTLGDLKIKYPYTETLIDDFNKTYLLKALEFGDEEFWWNLEESLYDKLYLDISKLFDLELPSDITMLERWKAHYEFEGNLLGTIIYHEDMLATWMLDEYDYPSEEQCENRFWQELMNKDE